MRAALIVIAVVVVITGVLTWWLLREPSVTTPTGPVDAQPLDERPAEFKHAERDGEEAFDAGVGRVTGRVLAGADVPAPGARVRAYATDLELSKLECGVCELPVFSCGHHTTVRKLIDGIRAQAWPKPQPIAETIAGPDGAFTFEALPLDALLYATQGERSVEEWVDPEAPTELLLNEPNKREVIIFDASQSKQLAGIKVSIFEPYEGVLREERSDAEGHLTIASSDPWAWVFIDEPGSLPVGQPLEGLSQFTLSGPKTLIVHTVMGGQPVETDVSLMIHRQERKFRTKDGVLRLDSLPLDYYTVTVGSEALAASEQSVELIDAVTELTFELRRGARVLVTAVSATGEPLEYVHGSLQGNDGNAAADAENGALLIIGPVPEGEYTLSIDARDMVTVTRQLDLHPGDTNVEVTLRVAPTVRGKVLLPDGKPAHDVRVSALESDTETALDFVGEDGTFTLSLQYPGAYTLRAQSNRDGIAEAKITVPCDPVTLTLDAKGVLEVELFDFDGTKLNPNFIVRSPGNQVNWINGGDEAEGMIGRLAGLETGSYTLEREIEDRVPMKKTVEVVSGKTTRVTFKADKGVSVAGRVIDAEGKPVANAIITVTDRAETTTTNEAGEFEKSGLTAGMVELRAIHENGAETEPVKVKAPSRDVVLKFAAVEFVTGRAVDEKGNPVTSFEANEVHVDATDGRFRVPAPSKTLDVWADGYVSVYLTVAQGDVGDVVLRKTPIVEGDVTDGEGKPVSGATVMGSADQGGVVTDANGRFKLSIQSDEAQDLIATRGPLSGRVPLKVGTTPHIVMTRGTTVIGHVVDSSGKGIPSVVTAVNQSVLRPLELDTDENGRFQAELARGVWLFSSRSFRASKAIEVTGERMEITIGEEAGACGAIIHAEKPIDSVWFLARPMQPSEGPWEVVGRVPGSMEVPIATPSTTVTARGIPCGHYEIAASIESMVTSIQAEVRQPQQPIELPLPMIMLVPGDEEAPPTP